jgi:hypothetical protein
VNIDCLQAAIHDAQVHHDAQARHEPPSSSV